MKGCQEMKIDDNTFFDLKIAAVSGNLSKVVEILSEIERQQNKKDFARIMYTQYKKTKNKAFLEAYLEIKDG